ncbi:MAG: hypothetical protein BWK79_08820 [Beggiatoa sp. IS2]|nr:MAG: hypothetical protein BWK79_08820 [Beggiatoa sp. IS2]
MLQTLEAVLNERGQLQFSEPLKFTQAQRVLVTLLNESPKPNLNHLEGMSHTSSNWFDRLQVEVETRKQLLQQLTTTYESRYHCSLTELEKRFSHSESDEHPAWEDSIEWRNAVEQLERIQLSEGVLTWLQNWLK